MAEPLGDIGIQTSDVVNVVGGLGDAIFYIVLVLCTAALVGAILWLLSYRKKRVILYEGMANGIRFRMYKAKSFNDGDGVTKWRIFGMWKTTPEPPAQSIYQDEKGKLIAQGMLIKGNIVWVDQLKVGINNDTGLKSINFDPLKAEDKALLVQELKAAEAYKKRKLGDLIAAAAPYLALILILTVFMIFFANVVQPTVDIGNQNVKIMQEFSNITSKLDVLINNRQVIGTDTTTGNNTIYTPTG